MLGRMVSSVPNGSELSQERFDEAEEFLKFIRSFRDEAGDLKYRTRLEQAIASGSKSLIIDFDDILQFNRELGSRIVKNPIEVLPELEKHTRPELASIDPVYASKLKRFNIRIRGLPERISLRGIKTEHLNTLVAVEGIVVRSTPVKSLLVVGRFACKKCGERQDVVQSGDMLKYPTACIEPSCARRGSGTFELLESESEFVDVQEIRLQERPEDLPAGQLPRTADIHVFDDMVDVARPGDRVTLVGIVIGEAEYHPFRGRYRTFNLKLQCNYMEVAGLEEEDITITQEEEKEFIKMSKDPWLFKKLVASVAPSIFGLEDEKEAIILQMLGGNAKELPDGVRIRGDINVFLIGDPGCLVADERIVLGNGAIVKIGQLGKEHLQPLDIQVLTGEGGGRRARATTFHVYHDQPILEIITESGKSIKGTYNHPVLVVTKKDFSTRREWRRLDELKIGDRVAITSGFPCTITAYIETGFEQIKRGHHGPKFKGRLPKYVTPEFASFCGYMLGGGWVCNDGYRFGFVVAEQGSDILPLLLTMVENLFGIKGSLSKRVGSNRKVQLTYVYLSNKDIAANLSFLKQKRVPDIIFRSGNEVASAFLKWLYEADGCIISKGPRRRAISLKSNDLELLRDVQMLLLRFGIHSRIVGNALMIRRGNDIMNFGNRIGFASKKKIEVMRELMEDARTFRGYNNQRSERIVKIVRHGRADVYDIEVPKSHRFIANGIISHNTAKSQLLKYVQKIAPRGLYTSGRGTTAAGLTATAVRERVGGFVLEAGALVLADRGIAAIDEFEKMRPEDRVAIHEAMEQQSYHPSVEISLANGRRVRIGKYVDSMFRKFGSKKISGINCEILSPPIHDELYSFNFESGSIERLQIDRVSRHVAPNLFVSIKYSNGRSILVTPEHPVFVFRDGSLTTVPAIDVRKGELVPAPKITIADHHVSHLSLAQPSINPQEENVVLPAQLTPSFTAILGYMVGAFLRGFSLGGARATTREGCHSGLLAADIFLDKSNEQPKEIGIISECSSILKSKLAMFWSLRKLHALNPLKKGSELVGRDAQLGQIRHAEAETRRSDTWRLPKLESNLKLLRVVEVRQIPNAGRHRTDWVYDVTVEPTHNFLSQGVLLHNTCSVAKGGIVATLNARTAILAAANPSLGRYDPNKLFVENVNLPPTILSRFDLIFVLKDVPDEDTDRRLANHILGYHRIGLSTSPDIIDQTKLRKYLSYCKKVRPKLTQEAADRLNDFFLEMRRLSSGGQAPIAITPRQLESLVRLSEARAKSFLRNEVLVEDAEAAIALMKKSLIQAGMDVETGQIDVDTLMTGKSKSTRDKMGKLLDLVAKLESSYGSANLDELENLAEKEGLDKHDFGRLISAMLREGLLYSPDEQSVKRARR
jgi:DNA replicative helicase MCM subunit Mcm2 (Cdc46/Mcm family)